MLRTAEVSQQPASIVPLCTLEMGIHGRGGSSSEGPWDQFPALQRKRKKETGPVLPGESNTVGELWTSLHSGILSGAQSRVTPNCPVGMEPSESAALCLTRIT